MAESTRRSGRATKGQHRGLDDAEPTPTPKKGGRGRKKQEPEPEEEESIIRCVCGATTEDDEEDRVMICCETCLAWQHNDCMEVPMNDEDLPEKYYCEQCKPADHRSLLEKIKKGEKPWEDRRKQREEDEEAARGSKGRGKKNKRGRPSTSKVEKTESNGAKVSDGDVAMNDDDVAADPRSPSSQAPMSPITNSNKRKHTETIPNASSPAATEPASKLRKASSTTAVQKPGPSLPGRRKSGQASHPKRGSDALDLQLTQVETITDLNNPSRSKVASALQKQLKESVMQAKKIGSLKLPEGQKEGELAEKLALGIEFAMYLNFWGGDSTPSAPYSEKFRAISFNLKRNQPLCERVLKGELSPNELTKMSTAEMASEELQKQKAVYAKENEKQHTLIQEVGPRIRRTHKGEEIVDADTHVVENTDAPSFTAPIRERPSDIDTSMNDETPEAVPMQSPEAVESPDHTAVASTDIKQPLKVDTKASPPQDAAPERKSSSTFNIHDVWSGIKATDPEQRNRRASRPSEPPGPLVKQQHDAEIDRLLKDEDQEEEEEYEPQDDLNDPEGMVWHGSISMPNIASFSGTGKHVAGGNVSHTIPWRQLLAPNLIIEGRIHTAKADGYLCGLRYSNTTDLTVVAVTPQDNDQDQAGFDKLFKYFTERDRYGVITKKAVENVKDAYVVPLSSTMEADKRPEFTNLLEGCKFDFSTSDRMLLLSYVIKLSNSPSAAQQTPHPPEVGAINSPLAATNPQGTPISGHPGFQNSPTPNIPYPPPPQQQPQYSHYGPSPLQGQGYPPPPRQAYNSAQAPPYNGPTGMEAARQVLRELADKPVVGDLLREAPNTGMAEFAVVRGLMERVPACHDNIGMLKGMLAQELQSKPGY